MKNIAKSKTIIVNEYKNSLIENFNISFCLISSFCFEIKTLNKS